MAHRSRVFGDLLDFVSTSRSRSAVTLAALSFAICHFVVLGTGPAPPGVTVDLDVEIPSQLMEIFGAMGIALVFFYVVNLPKDLQPRTSDFFAFVLTIVMIYPPIKSFTKLHNQLHQARAASERVFELLATSNSVPEPAAPAALRPGGNHRLDQRFERLEQHRHFGRCADRDAQGVAKSLGD